MAQIVAGDAVNFNVFAEAEPVKVAGAMVSTEFFDLLGVRPIRGRGFTEEDQSGDLGAADRPVRLRPAGDDRRGGGDVVHKRLASEQRPTFYLPVILIPRVTYVVRTEDDPAPLAAAMRSLLAALDPEQPPDRVAPMEKVLATAMARPRFNAWMLSLLALLAVGLSILGLYGVLHFVVSQRAYEICIRIALGASSASVFQLMLRPGRCSPAPAWCWDWAVRSLPPGSWRASSSG